MEKFFLKTILILLVLFAFPLVAIVLVPVFIFMLITEGNKPDEYKEEYRHKRQQA